MWTIRDLHCKRRATSTSKLTTTTLVSLQITTLHLQTRILIKKLNTNLHLRSQFSLPLNYLKPSLNIH